MKKHSHHKQLPGMQLIAIGFILMIAIGTFLLMLPISSTTREWTDFLTCLFTSTSASCVTGLVLTDTFTHWSLFGQIVLLILIQIGGLGFISFGVIVTLIIQGKLSLRTRTLIKDSVSTLDYEGGGKLVKLIMRGTIIVEGTGALLLAIRFIPEMGYAKGIYYGVFHSISAFCNAGFDLMGFRSPGSSFTHYVDDPVVNVTLILLILIGGLGFIVWNDIKTNLFHFKRYRLQSKVVLSASFILVFGGAFLYYLMERTNTLADLSTTGKICASFFGAVTPRTAGFNTVDSGALSEGGKLLSIILMFIGGCPGSTAGGVKVTTVVVLFAYLITSVKQTTTVNMFKRSIADDVVKKASLVCIINLSLAISASLIIIGMQGFDMTDTFFEIFSAVSTVGMSAGLTTQLNTASIIIVIIIMYLGRIGSLSFALSFTDTKNKVFIAEPHEDINVG